jgi:hypothetical protein
MKIKLKQQTMKKIVKLTETDLTRLVKRTINEMDELSGYMDDHMDTDEYKELDDIRNEISRILFPIKFDYIEKLEDMLYQVEESSKYDDRIKEDLMYEIESLIGEIEDLRIG